MQANPKASAEVRHIWMLYDTCKDAEVKLKDLLDMEEDDPYITTGNIRFHSSIAGGGTIFNDGCQMFEDTLYFIIDWRKRNEKQ